MGKEQKPKSLKEQIKSKSEQQKIKIAEAAIKADCISILNTLDKKILQKTLSINNSENLLNICKYSSKDTF